MSEGLTRDEDTALRCLAALADCGPLTDEYAALYADLAGRDRRTRIRRGGTIVPVPRTGVADDADDAPAAATG